MNRRTATLACRGILAAILCLAACDSNERPVVVGRIPNQTVAVGEKVTFSLDQHFSDPDGDDLAYEVGSSFSRVATASASGTSLTVAAVSQGITTVQIIATDPEGLVNLTMFKVTVPNRAPEVSDPIPDAEAHVGETVDVELSGHFGDPDGDDLSHAATSSDEGVATVSVSGATLTVAGVNQGTAAITVTATDPGSLSVEDVFEVTVSDSVRQILEAFYDAGNGDDWSVNTCWKRCDDLNDWHGVGYSGFPRRLQALQMDGNNVSGTVLPLLGGATDLVLLSLVLNDISGSIPAELGGLTKLASLRLAVRG